MRTYTLATLAAFVPLYAILVNANHSLAVPGFILIALLVVVAALVP